jgi:ethanolamine utilization protein EutA
MTHEHHHRHGDDHHHHHAIDLSEVSPAEASAGWHADNVELKTVGVDVGSSTSHLMFSRLHLQRLSQSLSSRFVVVEREVLHRSPILLTPYRGDGLIDVETLSDFIERSYREAGVSREDIDTGAVILTGTALERANARAVAELFAEEGGKFVCASAGHSLEALLAAHGSGAVSFSRRRQETVLNVDIGGGTSKFSLIQGGRILGTTAITVGARLVAFDPEGRVARAEPAAERLARRLGIELHMGEPLSGEDRAALAGAMADALVEVIRAPESFSGPTAEMLLLDPLPREPRPGLVTFSGGTSEFLYGRAGEEGYGDLAPELSGALLARRDELPGPVAESDERIRATVVGASQFSVQLSGNTIYVSDEDLLPLRNVPVALARLNGSKTLEAGEIAEAVREGLRRLDLEEAEGPVAVALPWRGEPAYRTVRALAEGVLRAHRERDEGAPIVVALDGDVGVTVGNILVNELGAEGSVVSVDGLELSELDFVDVGEVIRPANVVPVVIKSLVFPDSRAGASRSL